MIPEIKAKWIEALRSGRYLQGVGALKKDTKFCCLGVLCDVKDPKGWEGNNKDLFDGKNGTLPATVQNWSGVDQWGNLQPPVEFGGKFHNDLASLNDSGMTFTQIADVIEAQF